MIQNSKVIRENEFTSGEKILLLRIFATLKKLNENGELLEEVFARSKREPKEMLVGLDEELEKLQKGYNEQSYGYEVLQALIDEMKGVA